MTGAKMTPLFPSTIRYISTDSRSVSFPEETLFFALHSQRNNGHKYIKGLYQVGVRSFVVSEEVPGREEMKEANFLLVNDTLAALQILAGKHREMFRIPLIGITGSNGKTSSRSGSINCFMQTFGSPVPPEVIIRRSVCRCQC